MEFMERLRKNKLLADQLREAASLLEQQGANWFRVNAYRKAADTVESLPEEVAVVLETEGFEGLTARPGIGPLIGGAIVEMVRTGKWSLLERLRGMLDPEGLFAKVPGIGPKLSRRIIDELHLDTLESLETATYDHRLERVPGFGPRRTAMVRSALGEILGRGRWRAQNSGTEPPVATLLDVDREYRQKDEAGKLRRIAPKRFNPANAAWLPVLHTDRNGWQFTVLYSNTPRAHQLGRTRDWVVIYFHTDSGVEGQRTVVTETQGMLKGRRVVRGRESECGEHYVPLFFRSPNAA
jgi:putative hydrolase